MTEKPFLIIKFLKNLAVVEWVVNISIQIIKGLAKAHEKEIIHQDLKPANIMLTNEGHVKILDFGLAKLQGQTKMTKEGAVLGTAAYMSPEQARGGAVDHRTDIWALGVIMYEMLTGELPFRGVYEQAIIYSILNSAPEPLTAYRNDIPEELERIVLKALAKEPDDRYHDINALLADLKNLQQQLQPKSGETQLPVFEMPKLSKKIMAGAANLFRSNIRSRA